MRRWIGLVLGLLLVSGLGGCKAGGNANPLIGTWVAAQPNPPVAGQSTLDCSFTKFVFTPVHVESFVGETSGGPVKVTYTVEGNVVFASSVNDVPYTLVSHDEMYWSSPYGKCFFKRVS